MSYCAPFFSKRFAHDQESPWRRVPSHDWNHAPLPIAPGWKCAWWCHSIQVLPSSQRCQQPSMQKQFNLSTYFIEGGFCCQWQLHARAFVQFADQLIMPGRSISPSLGDMLLYHDISSLRSLKDASFLLSETKIWPSFTSPFYCANSAQKMVAFFAAVSHRSESLRKHMLTSSCSKGHVCGLWLVNWIYFVCLFVCLCFGHSSKNVVLIMTDGSEVRLLRVS